MARELGRSFYPVQELRARNEVMGDKSVSDVEIVLGARAGQEPRKSRELRLRNCSPKQKPSDFRNESLKTAGIIHSGRSAPGDPVNGCPVIFDEISVLFSEEIKARHNC